MFLVSGADTAGFFGEGPQGPSVLIIMVNQCNVEHHDVVMHIRMRTVCGKVNLMAGHRKKQGYQSEVEVSGGMLIISHTYDAEDDSTPLYFNPADVVDPSVTKSVDLRCPQCVSREFFFTDNGASLIVIQHEASCQFLAGNLRESAQLPDHFSPCGDDVWAIAGVARMAKPASSS